MGINSTAKRARETALKRHRRQLHRYRICCVALFLAGAFCGEIIYKGLSRWRSAPPPPITKVRVITYGYQDGHGVWRSYDTGQPITVKCWRP